MKLDTIYKSTKGGKVQEWTIEVVGNKYRTISGQTDGKKVVSEWTMCYGKNEGKANATTDKEQAMKEAEAKRKLKLERGYFENIKHISKKQYFEPMLAAKWEDYKDKVTYPIYSQPKLDGIRCIVTKDGMFSRNGKEIISAPHIRKQLDNVFKDNPNIIFDGELYADKFANDFNSIVSLVKKTKPTEDDLLGQAKEYAFSKKQVEYFEKKQKELREKLFEHIETSGEEDSEGHIVLELPEEVEGTRSNLRNAVKDALRPVQGHRVPVLLADLKELLPNWLTNLTGEGGSILTPKYLRLHLAKNVLGSLNHPLIIRIMLPILRREHGKARTRAHAGYHIDVMWVTTTIVEDEIRNLVIPVVEEVRLVVLKWTIGEDIVWSFSEDIGRGYCFPADEWNNGCMSHKKAPRYSFSAFTVLFIVGGKRLFHSQPCQ